MLRVARGEVVDSIDAVFDEASPGGLRERIVINLYVDWIPWTAISIASIAQLVEREAVNHKVGSSSPPGSA